MSELVEYYRQNGFETPVWLGETLGHDASYAVEPKYTPMRCFTHNESIADISAFCPLDENFTADFCKWVTDVAKCKPDMIMLDDDFRLSNRAGVIMGCLCDKHLKLMETKLGEKLDKNGLKSLVAVGGENKYRDAFLDSQNEAFEFFSKALRRAID